MGDRRLAVIGAGGHGQVVADILVSMLAASVLDLDGFAFLDTDSALHGETVGGLKVEGSPEDADWSEFAEAIVAIGDNRARRELFMELSRRGVPLVNAVHPSAILASSVRLGRGVMVCAGAIINPSASIADNTIVNTGAIVEHHCRVGGHAHLGPASALGGNVSIEEGALVGLGARVLPGLSIGMDAVVGAGAVVTRDVPSGVTVVGVPARRRLSGSGSTHV